MVGDDQLSTLIGHWAGDEQVAATAWTTAGVARATLTITPGPGGGLLIDYCEQRDGQAMNGHGVLAGDAWWWFDSYGFVPVTPGQAGWRDDALVLERHSQRGRTVTAFRVAGDTLKQRTDTAVPADAALVPLLRGSYTRQAA